MKLQFSSIPVSRVAIDAAKAKRAEAAEEARALAFAQDEEACQAVVNAGLRHRKVLLQAVEDYMLEFKKLENIECPKKFVEVLNTLSIRRIIGSVNLIADYDVVAE